MDKWNGLAKYSEPGVVWCGDVKYSGCSAILHLWSGIGSAAGEEIHDPAHRPPVAPPLDLPLEQDTRTKYSKGGEGSRKENQGRL